MLLRKKLLTIALMLLLAWLQSCKKDELPPTDPQKFIDCYLEQSFDSSSLSQHLSYQWKLTARSCFWTGEKPIDKEVILALNDSGTFYLSEQAIVILEGSWKIESMGNEYFQLDFDTLNSYLYGISLLCEGNLLFYDSPTDGCDNLFERVP